MDRLPLPTVISVHQLRSTLMKWREAGETVAFVPTMGALHGGHLALIDAARKVAKRSVVSIFVNPMQFGLGEDLAHYPRQIEQDQKLLSRAGCDLLYTPSLEDMYPQGFVTALDPGPMAKLFEGALRPGHFSGVATVVTKLLLQAMPDVAFFGEKDYQQLLIIRRTVHDLNLPVHIVGVPIVRDADGLALSSRNVYLSVDERRRATVLPKALQEAAARLVGKEKCELVLNDARAKITAVGLVVDYLELVDAKSLIILSAPKSPCRLIAAAQIGGTRLLDNFEVSA